MNAVPETNLPFPKRSGKVRDVYDLTAVLDGHLLIVATDRVSAYDVVMPTPIPGKGVILTQTALFWFQHFLPLVSNHLVTATVEQYPEPLQAYANELRGRSMLVRKLDIVPFECVARGYLAGSGWKDYQATGQVCGIDLPAGLQNGDRLPEPIFTPATKAEEGHDENVSFERMASELGSDLAMLLRDRTLELYGKARNYATERGILLADTKLEWGTTASGDVLLADEIFT
ncbi:MAG: phosphoribosylaminoimidazolesuccinocarboxamide synthase, partial [Planctomycetota bacterium]